MAHIRLSVKYFDKMRKKPILNSQHKGKDFEYQPIKAGIETKVYKHQLRSAASERIIKFPGAKYMQE